MPGPTHLRQGVEADFLHPYCPGQLAHARGKCGVYLVFRKSLSLITAPFVNIGLIAQQMCPCSVILMLCFSFFLVSKTFVISPTSRCIGLPQEFSFSVSGSVSFLLLLKISVALEICCQLSGN